MSRTTRSFIIWLQVSLQLLMPIIISGAHAASSPFSADRSQVNARSNTAQTMSYDGTGSNATGMATGMASFAIGDAIEQRLHQFGTAQVNLSTGTRFHSLEGSSLDLLIPFLDTPENVFFTQGGVRYNDDRVTTNLGLGHRHFTGGWMLGYNAFYDATWNNVNRRWGLGLEAWRDNMRLSSNLYQGISGWHNSRQHEGYDERPADGWDVRVDGWLPALPQLGMKAVYEQYYGNNVVLFNSFSSRQNNPHALTLGLNYTPFPLITVGVEQKMGKAGVNDTQFTAGLNYRIGESWSKQVSAAGVAALRDISNSRLELVNRKNEIVLDYRKETELKLGFPPQLTGEEGAVVTFTPTIKASNGVDHLELNDSALLQAGGQVISTNNTAVTLRMPAYQPQPIRLNGVAVDRRGNRSNVAEMLLVTTRKETVLTLTTDKTQANADGNDAIVATLYLADRSGTALTNQAVSWHATGGQLTATSTETDRNGNATVKLSSTTPGSFTITGIAGNKTATTEALHFTSVTRAQIAVDKSSVIANNTDAATYTLTVRNADNQPVSGQNVTWTTSLGNLAATSGTTDMNGQLTVKLTSATPGQATVSATTAGQTVTAPVVTFKAPLGEISLDVPTTTNNVINMMQSYVSKYTTSYSGMQSGDIITLSFNGFDDVGNRFTNSESYTVTASDTGKVAMGPYPKWLEGIQGNGISNNGTFTSTVTRSSTNESKSVSVTVTVDTVQ